MDTDHNYVEQLKSAIRETEEEITECEAMIQTMNLEIEKATSKLAAMKNSLNNGGREHE